MYRGLSISLQGRRMAVSVAAPERHGDRMIYFGIIAMIFAGDFFIKNHMERTLEEGEEKEKLNGFLLLRKHHNKGAFLNAGQKRQAAVAAVSVLLTIGVAAVFALSLGMQGNRMLKAGLSMLLGGAFSNTYDRLKRKYVVDYFSFHVKWKRLARIVFNLSDFGIILGALAVALSAGRMAD